MSETVYNKLVRDKIPEIITASGKKYTHHIAGDEEYTAKLREKIIEELEEYSLTPTVEEAADILEVVYAMFDNNGLKLDEIELVRTAKEQERGGFKQKIILETVSEDVEKRIFCGVDGCRAGWAVAILNEETKMVSFKLLSSFKDIVDIARRSLLTLIDIPIGLRGNERNERRCDSLARSLLGARQSSVFPVPIRSAVHASTYEKACDENTRIRGVKLSKQSWAIAAKIAETDTVMSQDPQLQSFIRETHPEVGFASINNWKQMAHHKSTPEGQKERLSIISQYVNNMDEVIAEVRATYSKAKVTDDDIVDAMVNAVVAMKAYCSQVPTLPCNPDCDDFGLRMEIVCGEQFDFHSSRPI